jgi:hypothetical protein
MTDNVRFASGGVHGVNSALRLLDKSGRASVDEGSCEHQEPSLRFGAISSLVYPRTDNACR